MGSRAHTAYDLTSFLKAPPPKSSSLLGWTLGLHGCYREMCAFDKFASSEAYRLISCELTSANVKEMVNVKTSLNTNINTKAKSCVVWLFKL